MLGKTELILICLVVVALLAIVARKIRIPYPILLTIGGVLLAVVPGLPAIHLDPQLVFNLFLPPLIYPAAVWTSWRDFPSKIGCLDACLLSACKKTMEGLGHKTDRSVHETDLK
jgi:monovalent cation/hydrogen antiporter